mmetsp:Transcript_7095/g.13045  ORF Transcript_7095/g.13045 Transcript_7095/m.13045 type:complete len:304 (-) Transcript_7095:251-1162(-)
MIMANNRKTTILHQAITGKGDNQARVSVMRAVLALVPIAASLPNGLGSLPIHTLLQRNVQMDAQSREALALALIDAYPESLLIPGGLGGRLPLHIAFTDYLPTSVISKILEIAPSSCFVRDRKGWLPIHIACSRNTSQEKLRMLFDVNPSLLYAHTTQGETVLQLATSAATDSHPNKSAITAIKARLQTWKGEKVYVALEGEAVDNKKNPLFVLASQVSTRLPPPPPLSRRSRRQIKPTAKVRMDMVPELVPEVPDDAGPFTVKSVDRAAATVLCRLRQNRAHENNPEVIFVGQRLVVQSAKA